MSYNVSGNAQRERGRKTEKIIEMIYGESLSIYGMGNRAADYRKHVSVGKGSTTIRFSHG